MSNHTPGPWRFDGKYVLATKQGYPAGVDPTEMVCTLVKHRLGSADRRPPEEERLANGALLAAAPDLLAFAESMAGFTAWVKRHEALTDTAERMEAVRLAAIAKARGEVGP